MNRQSPKFQRALTNAIRSSNGVMSCASVRSYFKKEGIRVPHSEIGDLTQEVNQGMFADSMNHLRPVETIEDVPCVQHAGSRATGGSVKQVYMITYPTSKIYIGKDTIGSSRYFGSPDMDIVNEDFASLPDDVRRDYTIRKQILWESKTATDAELSAKEVEMIREYRSNDPAIGYNRWPKFNG